MCAQVHVCVCGVHCVPVHVCVCTGDVCVRMCMYVRVGCTCVPVHVCVCVQVVCVCECACRCMYVQVRVHVCTGDVCVQVYVSPCPGHREQGIPPPPLSVHPANSADTSVRSETAEGKDF